MTFSYWYDILYNVGRLFVEFLRTLGRSHIWRCRAGGITLYLLHTQMIICLWQVAHWNAATFARNALFLFPQDMSLGSARMPGANHLPRIQTWLGVRAYLGSGTVWSFKSMLPWLVWTWYKMIQVYKYAGKYPWKIRGLGCVNRVRARARVTQPSPRIFLHICT